MEAHTDDSDATSTSALEEIISRARSLYTLPAVAAKVIQLTNNPKVDTRALKQCIETDPALTAKILRVVNSSLFGLSREVSDLNQALALLGTKPLKLLVLGFSLPQELFCQVAREQLEWYWSTTLVRAVAARAISEKVYDQPGDDAFLAGLLQDIGVLVLLGQLREPYAQFLSAAIEEQIDLRRVEVDSLGFDHLLLTTALLNDWQMPELLVKAIREPREIDILGHQKEEHSQLARILHMADLMAELVGNNRLRALPDLLEISQLYCGMDSESVHELISLLQPQVEQLADVLMLRLPTGQDYPSVLSQAHEQMSLLTESMPGSLTAPSSDETSCKNLLTEAAKLQSAMDNYLERPLTKESSSSASADETSTDQVATASGTPRSVDRDEPANESTFYRDLTLTVGQCRSRRQPLSLILLGAEGESTNDETLKQIIKHLLDVACRVEQSPGMICKAMSPHCRVVLLPDFERQQAVQFAQQAIDQIEGKVEQLELRGTSLSCLWAAGVASVMLPPKNFPPRDLLETAQRCLSAVHAGGASGVKSLEIY